jgi:hypothetical protein
MTQQNNGWTLDRNLSVGLIAAVLIQAGAFIWYASKLDSRVVAVETAAATASQENGKLTGKVDEIREKVVRIETKLDFLVPAQKPQGDQQ